MKKKVICKLLSVAFLGATALTAHAQDYPNRPIELTVPYGAGGATDVMARKFAQLLEKELGANIIVVNKPGAQGTLQMGQLSKAKPDGYSLGVAGYNSLTYTAQRMSKPPFKTADFAFLGEIGTFSYGLVVPSSSNIHNLSDYVQASTKPNGMSYGVTGAPNNIPYATLGKIPGARFEEVNYKSGLEAVTAVAGNHVESALQNPQDIIPMVQSGQVRLISSMTDKRIAGYEDIPTAKEQGFDVSIYSSLGLAAPTGIPTEVEKKLEAATMRVLQNPEYVDFMKQQHMYVNEIDGAGFTQRINDGYVQMGNFIKEMNIPMLN
jgi:tripartite-type tricarboxylate transporter receptor subunit TctC